jgi:hypothetical protein
MPGRKLRRDWVKGVETERLRLGLGGQVELAVIRAFQGSRNHSKKFCEDLMAGALEFTGLRKQARASNPPETHWNQQLTSH